MNEAFPHSNNNIDHGSTNHSDFLDAFTETKLLICQWANKNLDRLSCENIGKFIRSEIIPYIYKSYLEEDSDSEYEPLSQQEFLALFSHTMNEESVILATSMKTVRMLSSGKKSQKSTSNTN